MKIDGLLKYYESELAALRQQSREYAERYPRIAAGLQLNGDTCGDRDVERLIESFALVAARLSKRLDDDLPQVTESYLEALFPHFLRPFPSCSIARLDLDHARYADSTAITTIARGTEMNSAATVQGVHCRFRTVYDLVRSPIALGQVSFDATTRFPPSVCVPKGVTCAISIEIAATSSLTLPEVAHPAVRVFIDGDPSFCAALRDTLFMRSLCAFIETQDGRWQTVQAEPIAAVGFADEDALIPFTARSHHAYRTITEYFGAPEKFNFFDIKLATLAPLLPPQCRRFKLHIGVADLRSDSKLAQVLGNLSHHNLLLGCTPVVNLFRKSGVPITVDHAHADYAVLADANHARAYDIHSIDKVHMLRERALDDTVTEFRPFYRLRHGESDSRRSHYWVCRRDDALALRSPGHEHRIAFVDTDFHPLGMEKASVSLELTCSNRDLPTRLSTGLPGGDLVALDGADGPGLQLLRRPSAPYRVGSGHGAHWRLISHLTWNHHSLVQAGLQGFREMLTLFDTSQSAHTQRQIAGIVGLEHAPTSAWMRGPRGAAIVHGIEVRVRIDTEAFVGSGIHIFSQMLDRFLGQYVQLNNFTELIIVSDQTGSELIRCKPRSGDLNLV
jgi:type VI secretion system protein ImpG